MKKHRSKHSVRALALALALCLLAGLFPATLAAEPRSAVSVSTEEQLRDAVIDGAAQINLTADIELTQRLVLTRDVTIQGGGHIIYPASGGAFTSGTPVDGGPYNGLLFIRNTAVILENLTLWGKETRCILVSGGTLGLSNCTIRNGKTESSESGAGVALFDGATLAAGHGTRFQNNNGVSASFTSGGGLYVGQGCSATLTDVSFENNSAHSGGAIYTYLGTVTCTADTAFTNNVADQRGGAIFDHGVVVLNGTTIEGQSCNQYGGGVYVSAGNGSQGRLVLENATIQNNTAGNSGGGVFIANGAEVYVGGSSKVTGNQITEGNLPNNLYAATSTSKIVTYSTLGCEADELGVSTGNPYKEKLLVFSLTDRPDVLKNTPVPTEYIMTREDRAKFTYDSEVFLLAQAGGSNSNDMWLTYNPKVSGGEGGPKVIFDYNLPGAAATVYPSESTLPSLSVGQSLTLPVLSAATAGGVTFTPTGWWSDAQGGEQYTDAVTVAAGTRIYYAQWETETTGSATGGTLYNIYWDYNYKGGGVTAALTGTFDLEVEVTVAMPPAEGEDAGSTTTAKQTKTVTIPFSVPKAPGRTGYTFKGWAATTSATSGTMTPLAPTGSTTFYAVWEAQEQTLNWNANGGQGGSVTTQRYDDTVAPPSTKPTREGYTFTGWYLDKNCTVLLTSGTKVLGDATFYAGWDALKYTITWNANYTGGAVYQTWGRYDETIAGPETPPVREGFAFVEWNTAPDGSGTALKDCGPIHSDMTFYAIWGNTTTQFTVQVEWLDQDDNDGLRPEGITVALTRNGIPTGATYTLTKKDAGEDGNLWTYTFEDLPQTDNVSQGYVYGVSLPSGVPGYYISEDDTNRDCWKLTGYIPMVHDLIRVEIPVYVAWDDDTDRDGKRPAAVRLQLTADGTPIEDNVHAVATISGDGDSWQYTFAGMKKYAREDDVTHEIAYGFQASPAAEGDLDSYEASYSDFCVTLTHQPEETEATVAVVWADSANQDGKRPVSMFVQLYADNIPMSDRYVLLSDANYWEYTWRGLTRYKNGGQEIEYSAHVTSTLLDYTAATSGMTIEMTYVPSSTTITAFASWEDCADVDGLRLETLTAELVADGKPTGDKQILAAANGWTTSWTGYPMYKNGSRIEYTFQLLEVPQGYEAEYTGIYDTSGLSVLLKHQRITAPIQVNVVWDDDEDVSMSRPSRVKLMLYADGAPLPEKVAVVTQGDDWTYTFDGLPVYRDGGEKIVYTVALASSAGVYTPKVKDFTVTMTYHVPDEEASFKILWDDNENADGRRPNQVMVTLTKNGVLTEVKTLAAEANDWTAVFSGLKPFEAANPGQRNSWNMRVDVPEGYAATYADTACVLTLSNPAKVTVMPVIHWMDHEDQYGERPEKLLLALTADGNEIGNTVSTTAAVGWICPPFENLPKYRAGGQEIRYGVLVDGRLDAYRVQTVGEDVYLTHKSLDGVDGYTTQVTVAVRWKDNDNALGKRPVSVPVTIFANGAEYGKYTLSAQDAVKDDPSLWTQTVQDLPTKLEGKTVIYTVMADARPRYVVELVGDVITMTESIQPEVTANWSDNSNKEGKRPEDLTVRLIADGEDTGLTLSLKGEGDSWTGTFPLAPVWNGERQVAYTFQTDDRSTATLNQAGYTVSSKDGQMTMTLKTSGGEVSTKPSTKPSGGSVGNKPSAPSTPPDTKKQVAAYVVGYVDGSFRPDGAIARCEAVALIARISSDYDPNVEYPVTFRDVDQNAWYKNALGYCFQKGYIIGCPDGVFAPYTPMTRAEFAVLTLRLAGVTGDSEVENKRHFTDIGGHWAEQQILCVSNMGWVQGDGSGAFYPDRTMTRAAVVTLTNKALDRAPDKKTLEKKIATAWFTDVLTDHWAYWEIAEATYDHAHQ